VILTYLFGNGFGSGLAAVGDKKLLTPESLIELGYLTLYISVERPVQGAQEKATLTKVVGLAADVSVNTIHGNH